MLKSENVRWAQSITQYCEQKETLCGDVLLIAAFISYAGSFSKRYCCELVQNIWMPYLRNQKVNNLTSDIMYFTITFLAAIFMKNFNKIIVPGTDVYHVLAL